MLSDDIYKQHVAYQAQGFDTLPIPPGQKGPTTADWNGKAERHEYTEADFLSDSNLGVLLGGKLNLVDIDCDDPLSALITDELLEAAGIADKALCIFGHQSKPNSHYFFQADQCIPSMKIMDPVTKKAIIELRCLDNDGTRGKQTVIPPSIHPSGERITFVEGYEL